MVKNNRSLIKLLLLVVTSASCIVFICDVSRAQQRRDAAKSPVKSAASTPTSLRVMTYNIHVGEGMDKRQDLARIAAVINEAQPALVGLQEVDRGVARTGRVDQIAELARLTNMEYAFAPNLDFQGGKYGVAVLSRFKIVRVEHRMFRNLYEAERRGSLRVEVEVKNGLRVSFVTTHLDYQHDDNRLYEASQLLQPLRALQMPVIIVGDFNEEPNGATHAAMIIEYLDAQDNKGNEANKGLTFPANKPVKRIDYVFYGRTSGVRVKAARVIETQASDHLPVVADLEIN